MSSSATWQELPNWLMAPVMDGVLTLAEAAQLWDVWLMSKERDSLDVPPALIPASSRLRLWATDCGPTRH